VLVILIFFHPTTSYHDSLERKGSLLLKDPFLMYP
jgi:hypothetical protein